MTYSAITKNSPAIQPRGGRSTSEAQFELWNSLISAGADVLPLTIDSKTRLGKISEATSAHILASATGSETLNGYPLLSVPIKEAKELISSVALPVSLRHGTPYAESLVRRALEVGVQEIEGGPLSYTLPYSRDANLIRSIESWKNVEKLCNKAQHETGLMVIRESFGVLTACMVHPLQALLVGLIETAFTLSYGGGLPMVSFGSLGCDYQDMATITAFRSLTPWLIDFLNLPRSEVFIAFHHWMGPFPTQEADAKSIIASGTRIAQIMSCEKVVTKTYEEAHGVPTNQANHASVKYVRSILDSGLKNPSSTTDLGGESNLVLRESEALVSEAKLQLNKLFSKSHDLREIVLASVAEGYIDPPFCPHQGVLKQFKTLRANDGSIRVSQDYPGKTSREYLKFEQEFSKSDLKWGSYSSDQIAEQIRWPFKSELGG